jgi:hypothetical protein
MRRKAAKLMRIPFGNVKRKENQVCIGVGMKMNLQGTVYDCEEWIEVTEVGVH